VFAEPPDPAATTVVPVDAEPDGAEDMLVSLLEDVIFAVDVLSVVPVRVHLVETEDGGMAGDLEVVPLDQVSLVEPVPKAVSYHELSVTLSGGKWRCHVLIEV